ncbi:MAG: hypothetical protein JNM90_05565, partial [Burkholderiales bacterium]|nr:hypothetical protein [Burkholderiales bacterium]
MRRPRRPVVDAGPRRRAAGAAVLLALAVLGAAPGSAPAQRTPKVPLIGYLAAGPPECAPTSREA